MGLCTVPMETDEAIGARLLAAPPGTVQLVAGLTRIEAQALLEPLTPSHDRPLVLFLSLAATAPAEAVIEDLVLALISVTAQVWPCWYTDADFSTLRNDTLGLEAARVRLKSVARETQGLSQEWARAAVQLAMRGKSPRPPGIHWSIEVAQLCLAIHAGGLVLAMDFGPLPEPGAAHALVHALESVAYQAKVAVVILCETLPEFVPPYDRLLTHATIARRPAPLVPSEAFEDLAENLSGSAVLLAPVAGRPHPQSEVEKRVARAIAAAPDLCTLFHYNQLVETVRGSRPKVDLLWREGRLVVELDGYPDHSKRAAFFGDRHRDYELALTGYTVLRLANEEVLQDVEKAVDKIRDMVEFLSSRNKGALARVE